MPVIDLSNVKAVFEADGKIRCINCIDGGSYWKGCDPDNELLITQEDLENPEKLYICDYCEEEP